MTTKFTDDHEWARQENDLIVVGITHFAQEQLGEIVYIELPDTDRSIAKGEEAAVIESVKAAGEIKSPVSGTVAEVNETLTDSPEKVNEDAGGEGWVYKIKPDNPAEFDELMDLAAYESFVATLD